MFLLILYIWGVIIFAVSLATVSDEIKELHALSPVSATVFVILVPLLWPMTMLVGLTMKGIDYLNSRKAG